MTNLSTALDIKPIGGVFGAEVRGIDLGSDLQPATIHAIHQAVLRYKTVFFRGQDLDDYSQEAFARLWGKKLVPHPAIPSLEGTEAIFDVDASKGGRANRWHSDFSFVDAYPSITILRAAVLPERGGDTLWADSGSAYKSLPQALQVLADQIWAVHSNQHDYAGGWKHFNEAFKPKLFETEHPLVRVHPITGEKLLVLGSFIRELTGFDKFDSYRLLEIFNEHLTRPENTLRWRWSHGDVAIWDNYATAHRAVDDYGDLPRIARRTTLEGEVPVSVDGRRSVTRVLPSRLSIAA
jgi:taurine dioxygenase